MALISSEKLPVICFLMAVTPTARFFPFSVMLGHGFSFRVHLRQSFFFLR